MTRIGYRTAAAAAALVLLSACTDGDETVSVSADQPVATPEPAAGGKAASIEFDAEDFTFALDKTTFKAGKYTFTVKNVGKAPHVLQIDGPGVKNASTGNIAPGATGTVAVRLKKGTYSFTCPVGDHVSKGMKNEITVT